ncbi:MAG TPA: hypothetical protein VF950_09710 [Planctomycetota bacterium]
MSLLLLLLQAEETFKTIEARIEKAASLHVRFTRRVDTLGDAAQVDRTSTSHGLLAVGKSGQVRYELNYKQDATDKHLCLYDGARLRVRHGRGPIEEREAAPGLKAIVLSLFARGGTGACGNVLSWGQVKDSTAAEQKKLLQATNFRDVQGRTGLGFTHTPLNTPQDTADSVLWYDPKTFDPKKREDRQELAGLGRFVVTETYEIREDAPDDLFSWPADK